MSIELTVNGERTEVEPGTDVRGLMARLEMPERGVAVAVDGTLYPRSRWDQPLTGGAVLEIVTAVQGG